jgi:tRNA-Thr(GGU) m(6)t(6)A37 methyltransferase TsaA
LPMGTETITYRPIGVIHTPFKEPKGTPIQPAAAPEVEGTVEIFAEFAEGLADMGDFSHIVLVYHFHLSKKASLRVKPYMGDTEKGVFATRAPSRPNPIGISVVRLVRLEGNTLWIRGVDMVDGTPLLDIKPCVPEFDVGGRKRKGWLKENLKKLRETRDDGRFSGE